MKNLLLFFALIIAFQSKSQTQDTGSWSPAGATWVYKLNESFSLSYMKWRYIGDTMIQDKQVKKINNYFFDYIGVPGVMVRSYDQFLANHYFHYSNDTVYQFIRDTFRILYVFSAQVGDSWPITETGLYSVDSINLPPTDTLTVNGIANISTADNNLTFDLLQTNRHRFWRMGDVVKNIGGSHAFVPVPIDTMHVVDSNVVICFGTEFMENLECYCDELRGTLQFTYRTSTWVPQTCAEIIKDTSMRVGVEKNIIQNYSISYYPNPVFSQLTVDIQHDSKAAQHYLRIYNTMGQLLSVQKINNQQNVDISHLPAGTYLFLVENPYFSQTFKIIKL